jgi:hypothetical protein
MTDLAPQGCNNGNSPENHDTVVQALRRDWTDYFQQSPLSLFINTSGLGALSTNIILFWKQPVIIAVASYRDQVDGNQRQLKSHKVISERVNTRCCECIYL